MTVLMSKRFIIINSPNKRHLRGKSPGYMEFEPSQSNRAMAHVTQNVPEVDAGAKCKAETTNKSFPLLVGKKFVLGQRCHICDRKIYKHASKEKVDFFRLARIDSIGVARICKSKRDCFPPRI